MNDETVETGQAPEPSVVPDDQVTTQAVETEPGEGNQPKPKQKMQERFNEVYGQKKQAEREAEALRAELQYYRTQAMQPAPQPTQVEEQIPQPPDPAQFQDGAYDPAFIQANAAYTAQLSAYEARKVIRESQSQQQQAQQANSVLQTFQQNASEAGEEGQAALRLQRDASSGTVPVPPAIGRVLTNSPNGVQLAAHLDANRGELFRIAQLPEYMQTYELAKIEAQVTAEPAPTVPDVQPYPTVDGQTAGKAKTSGWKSQAEYRAHREAQKAKR